MRKSASEILRNLEKRIARLEKQSSRSIDLDELSEFITKELSKLYQSDLRIRQDVYGELMTFFQDFEEFYDDGDEWSHADDGVHDLQFEIKDSKPSGNRGLELKVEVDHAFGSEVVKFQVHSERRRIKIKKASSSRFAQESFKRGDMVMLLTVKPGQAGSYANPGMVESVMGDDVRVSVGMASLIVPVEILVKATGNKAKDVRAWQENH